MATNARPPEIQEAGRWCFPSFPCLDGEEVLPQSAFVSSVRPIRRGGARGDRCRAPDAHPGPFLRRCEALALGADRHGVAVVGMLQAEKLLAVRHVPDFDALVKKPGGSEALTVAAENDAVHAAAVAL